jgi:CPA1 family monovalent cation:H+ antiporter
MTSATRVIGTATWGMVIFVVNGLAFLLSGLQLPTVRQDVAGIPGDVLAGMALAICATVILLRLAWVFPATYLPRMLSASLRRRDPAPPPAVALILGWGGMRGAVTLAAALALPLQTDAGDPLPGRGLVIFLAFSVILVTLIGQGLTLPALIRALGVIDDGSLEHEIVHARMVAADAALVRIEELRAETTGHLPMLDRLRDQYLDRREHLDHDDGDADEDTEADAGQSSEPEVTPEEIEELEHDAIRRSVISAERIAVVELRDRDEISDAALRAVERDLDLDELRREA